MASTLQEQVEFEPLLEKADFDMTKRVKPTPAHNGNAEDFDLMTFLPNRLAILSRLTQVLLASALEESDLTVAQWRVYLCLTQLGPSTLNAIAEFTQLPQSSLSRSVARMAERGLVHNARNEEDRRLSSVEITDLGSKELQSAIQAIRKQWGNVLATAPIDEKAFLTTVNDLISHLSSVPNAQ